MSIKQLIIINIFIILFALILAYSDERNQIYEKESDKPFPDLIQDAEFIITENNFRITNRLHIGAAIQKRGGNDFPNNEVILFCNLTIAEEMLKIEPRYINYCPYKITITEFNNKYRVGTRLLPPRNKNRELDKFAKKTNRMLRSMVEYTASEAPFIPDENAEEND